jgi:hypothetical protein
MRIIKHLKSDWFRYGFETLAVVVGILVAFALDNWNEEGKQDSLELQYLNGLRADLVNDTAYYDRRIYDSEWIFKNHAEFIQLMYQTQNKIEDVWNLFEHVDWNSEHLTTHNSTYIELTNSGSLSIISNLELKDLLVDYYRENERAATHISEFNEVSSRHLIEVGNVVRNYAKIHNMHNDIYGDKIFILDGEWEFINNPSSEKFQTIEYAIGVYRLKHNAFLNHFRHLRNMSIQLIDVVQKDLELRM